VPHCGSKLLWFAVNVRCANDTEGVIVLGPGVYGPDSCGGHVTRPVSITGAGSGATIIDCGGVDRGLTASASLHVSLAGVTFTGGFANVSLSLEVPSADDDDDNNGAPLLWFAGGGGGGVAVLWPASLNGAWASFVDTHSDSLCEQHCPRQRHGLERPLSSDWGWWCVCGWWWKRNHHHLHHMLLLLQWRINGCQFKFRRSR
jgi:hypothetical protein